MSRRQGGRRWRAAAVRETVLHHALDNPTLGPKKLACLLRELPEGGCAVSHGTISAILRAAALNTVAARRSRLSASAGVAESADAQDLGSCVREDVGVQVPSPAPTN